jgi:hypothetical protein
MLRLGHRLLPLRGSFPTPGSDVSGALWQELMDPREVALFCFDGESGRPLKVNGEVPETQVSEYCMAYRDRLQAKQVARGTVTLHPHVVCALYSSRGKWLETVSRLGIRQRNEGLGLALLLLRFPLLAVLGLSLIVASSGLYAAAKHAPPPDWVSLTPTDWAGLTVLGLLVGGCAGLLIHGLHLAAIYLHGRPARQPLGSLGREGFYRQLVREKGPNLLVPRDITFQPGVLVWPQPEKHDEWAAALGEKGFQLFGRYFIPEVKIEVEFWVNSAENLIAQIIYFPGRGMWVSAYTRYLDGSSITVAARNPSGLDSHPTKKMIYLGPDATVPQVLDHLKRERPSAGQLQLTLENILPLYQQSWREFIDWRRSRGTSLEEYRRIDAIRLLRKRASSDAGPRPLT